MANPVVVPCPVGIWTKVATNQTTGLIHIVKIDPDAYYQTYRITDDVAPTDLTDAVPFTDVLQISDALGIDVYIWPKGGAGIVRVDL